MMYLRDVKTLYSNFLIELLIQLATVFKLWIMVEARNIGLKSALLIQMILQKRCTYVQ